MTQLDLAALPLRYLNRHVLITGATGTGKTVTLAALVESLAGAGVPVLAIDAKGDLESLGRVVCPYGERGERAPLDLFQLGPEIMARALDLSEAQSGVLYVLHEMAQGEGQALATLADLRALASYAAANARDVSTAYGLVSPASLAALQRGLLRLDAGAFGRPGFDMAGRSGVTVYAAAKLARKPEQYAAAVAWMLLDLYERCPERGDLDRPALAVVIDEAHLIFEGIPASLERRLASVARLIRSKGVALIWASQAPADLPAAIAGQCLTRIQHGLRASTPAQLRDIKAAADSLPQPAAGFDAVAAILALGVGQALVSLPDETGTPQPCQLVKIKAGNIRPRPRISPPGSKAETLPRISPPDSKAERLPFISPPGSYTHGGFTKDAPGRGIGLWIHPARFIAYTVALVAIMALFG